MKVGGVYIGDMVNSGANGHPLGIRFNGNATLARVQTLLRSIGFRTSGGQTELTRREVTFTLTDERGATSTPAKVRVVVRP